ncbi:HAD family hydrolase [Wenzhouxiangella marina]|uniref:phosphoglycolate phosphatase n=1 Tax=Wenzhouxiangella marina TaxID=1579979 RepID=A0A0K0XZI0_9GAMM|nr:HAD family hydrolase [Wenzhouxiangella marina]AKS43042.1 Phosphatase [Wenzhouxiangella marina]MBB6087275.1 phosphoglycolate phosphatase [Wenzhouxiangella marina]
MRNLIQHIPAGTETIVFDWNGTLLDDVDYCLSITNAMLQEFALPKLTRTRYRDIFTFPVQSYYQQLGFDFSRHPFPALATRWMQSYTADVATKVDLFHETETMIADLKRNGYRLAILTAAIESDVHELLAHHGIDEAFDEVYGLDHCEASSKVERGKQLYASMGLDPGRTLLIGDTDHDFEVGRALGAPTLLLADGHQSYERLQPLECKVLPTRYG